MKKGKFGVAMAILAGTICIFGTACDPGIKVPPLHTHTWKAEWERKDGYHWHACEGCDEKGSYAEHDFTNGDCVCGEKKPETPPPPHKHVWKAEWTTGNGYHWHACEGCDEKDSYAAHDFTNGDCVCGEKKPETPPPPHTHEWKTEWERKDGYHWHACEGCDGKDSYAAHDFTNGDCVCGEQKPETPPSPHTHVWRTEWERKDGYHWHSCEGCDEKGSYTVHDFANGDCVCGEKERIGGTEGLTYAEEGDIAVVTGIGSATETEIEIATEYHGKPVTKISDSAFKNCKSMTAVTIGYNITEIGFSAFEWCDSLTMVVIFEGVTRIGSSAFKNCDSLFMVNLPDSVTELGSSAFDDCDALTYVTLPKGITTISWGAFSYCKKLTEITLPVSVAEIDSFAFYYCTSLKEIAIPEKVEKIGSSAFESCTALTAATIGNRVESIGSAAFKNCKKLQAATIPKGITEICEETFGGCAKLERVAIPEGVTTIGASAFRNCIWLTEAAIPNGVIRIENFAFQYCGKLKELVLPESVTTIGEFAFAGCSSLEKVVFSDSLALIGNSAFSNCSSLDFVVLGNRVQKIGYSVFYACGNLNKVYYKGTAEEWDEMEISGSGEALATATRHFYSETEPALNEDGTAYCGNYWRYAADGVTIVEWKKENE